jgi:curved DNA-binding protein CbpA
MDSEPLPPDPYVALGVSKDADSAAIKTAYRKLVLKYHPDKCTDDAQRETNVQRFHKIQKAYELVGQDEERKRYDAMVRLHELREEKIKLQATRGPIRPPMRGQSYYPTAAPMTSSTKAYNFEERTPKFADVVEQLLNSKIRTESYAKRSPQPVRVERDDDDRRRADRLRERAARSRTYDYSDDKYSKRRDYDDAYDRQRKKDYETYTDSTDRKYADLEDIARRYTSKAGDVPNRPGMHPRRTATRDIPQFETRRSRASPRERDYDDDEFAPTLKERETIYRVAERLAERRRARKESERDRSRERVKENKDRDRERDREQRERERRVRDKERTRERADKRTYSREDVDDYDGRRPASLKPSYSSPPYAPGESFSGESLPRAQTFSTADPPPAPPLDRHATFPSIQTAANTSAKRDKQYPEAKAKKQALGDSGYSSSSQPEDRHSSKKGKPKEKVYSYPVHAEPYGYRTEVHAPAGASPPKERPSGSRRPSMTARTGSYTTEHVRPQMPHAASTSRVLPDRTRRRDRDREPDYKGSPISEKLYGEMRPGYPPGHPPRAYREADISRGKRYDYNDIQYSPAPSFSRNNSMPVSAS